MMLRLPLAVVIALATSASDLKAQGYAEVEGAQIDSLSTDITAEWRRLARLPGQGPLSDATRSLNAFFSTSAREAMEISARIQFIETLRAESPDNPSLTRKLQVEAARLRRQTETLRNVVHDVSPGGNLDRLLQGLLGQAAALEQSLGRRR